MLGSNPTGPLLKMEEIFDLNSVNSLINMNRLPSAELVQDVFNQRYVLSGKILVSFIVILRTYAHN